MKSFLGTRITKHEVKDVEEKLKKIRKNYDEYDLYIYYKKVLETEKKKRLKEKEREKERNDRKEIGEEKDTFEPCQFITSIYKKSEIKKKDINYYIDKEDSIYEDIIVNPIFKEPPNYVDDNSLTFFNETISYTLLRNCGYVDGFALGVNLNKLNFLQKFILKKKNESNLQNIKSDSSPFDEKEKSCLAVKDRENESFKTDRQHKPNLYKEIRQNFREDIDNTKHKLQTIYVENDYALVLNNMKKRITEKLRETQKYEKQIKELYRPKNNFEGAYYISANKKKSDFSKLENLSSKKKQNFNYSYDISSDDNYSGAEIENKNIFRGNYEYENYPIYKKKHIFFPRENSENLFNREEYLRNIQNAHEFYLKKEIDSDELTGSAESIKSTESIKKNKNNCFLIDDVTKNEKQKKMEQYASFYNSLKRSLKNENYETEKRNNKNYLLYYQYSKLKRGNIYQNDRKEDLLNLYTPAQKWVAFNNDENKNMVNEIADIKRKINFNNNLKKKNRFIFYCKARENKIGIQNIFNKAEYDEFNDLMEKSKLHENFYTKEILEEGLESNFHMQDYHFNKEVLKKLNISLHANNENNDDEKSLKMIKLIPHVPLSFFLEIFD